MLLGYLVIILETFYSTLSEVSKQKDMKFGINIIDLSENTEKLVLKSMD